MRTALFRQQAVETRRVTLVGSVLQARRLPFRLITGLSLVAALSLVALAFFGQYTRKVHVDGYLTPTAGMVKIQAGQSATLTEKHVKEGQRVRRGDVLFVLSTERASPDAPQVQAAATAAIRARLAGIAREHEAQRGVARLELEGTRLRLQHMRDELAQIQGMVSLQEQRVATAQESQAGQERLRLEGFLSPAQVDLKRNDLLEQRARLSELIRSGSALGRDMSQLRQTLATATLVETNEQSRYERERVQLTQDAVESESRRVTDIIAPADGVAAAVLGEVGMSTQPQTVLLTLLPADGTLQAKLLVPSRAIGFLAVGDRVSMRYPAFPYQRFGSFNGRVVEIPRAMVTSREADTPVQQSESVYRVSVALDAQDVRTGRAVVPLQADMSLEADVWLERRRLVDWFFEPLLGLGAKV